MKSITKHFNLNRIKFNLSLKNKFAFFSTATTAPTTTTPPKKFHGGLKDSDRIYTNLYCDGDPFIEGALKRVNLIITLGRLASN
jgi:hypothetical protein